VQGKGGHLEQPHHQGPVASTDKDEEFTHVRGGASISPAQADTRGVADVFACGLDAQDDQIMEQVGQVERMLEEAAYMEKEYHGIMKDTAAAIKKLRRDEEPRPPQKSMKDVRRVRLQRFGESRKKYSQEKQNNGEKKYDLIELFTGKAPISRQIDKQGGTSERCGLEWGVDLRTGAGKMHVGRLMRQGARHLWCSPPCQPFSQWQLMNTKTPDQILRLQQKRAIGWQDCRYTMTCMDRQRTARGEAHWEYPLGAFKELMKKKDFRTWVKKYIVVRWDQCMAGLTLPGCRKPM